MQSIYSIRYTAPNTVYSIVYTVYYLIRHTRFDLNTILLLALILIASWYMHINFVSKETINLPCHFSCCIHNLKIARTSTAAFVQLTLRPTTGGWVSCSCHWATLLVAGFRAAVTPPTSGDGVSCSCHCAPQLVAGFVQLSLCPTSGGGVSCRLN